MTDWLAAVPATAPPWLWAAFTIAAAGAQTVRNATQRSLTGVVGTAGATHVRFLFGLPFALVAALLVRLASGVPVPAMSGAFLGWVVAGSIAQIVATALMLSVMQRRAFVVATTYVKTEPIQVAVFAAAFLGERLAPIVWAGVVVATAGVLITSWPRRMGAGAPGASSAAAGAGAWLPAIAGLASAAMFSIAAVGFRGAVQALGDAPFVPRASYTLACSLAIQSALLTAWLAWREPGVLGSIARAWRRSIAAGFTGALASQCWLLAFALQSVAPVRTLALVEILFAQLIGWRLFRQPMSRHEWAGIALIVAGALAVVNA